MDGKSKRLSDIILRGSGSDMALHAYAELKANDGIEGMLRILRSGGNYSVSHLGGTLTESESLSMISDTDIISMDGSEYKTKRLMFAPKRSAPISDIKYAATGFTENIYEDNYSKSAVIDVHTGESGDTSKMLIGGTSASLMVMNASERNPTSEIYFDYGEGASLGFLKLEFTSEKISQKSIKDAFLQGYNGGGVAMGVQRLLELAEENFEDHVCITYPDLLLRHSESLVNSEGQSVSRENASTLDLPTFVIFHSQGTSFITSLSKATSGESVRNSIFKIRRAEIKSVSNLRPYIEPSKEGMYDGLYQ